MNELRLCAVGSSPLIADEIAAIVKSLLGETLSLHTALTGELQAAEKDTFYICAVTQEKKLSAVLPAKQLFVFDLHPTTRFFLDIAQIPAGTEVYVFNNRLPYTDLLAKECRDLGIRELTFHSIAYDEMPEDDVRSCLQSADFIIGVDRLVGEKMLFSERYRPYLKPNVQIIPGQRAASIASTGRLLAGIACFYRNMLDHYQDTANQNGIAVAEAEQMIQEIEDIIQMLKEASQKAVTSQVSGLSLHAPVLQMPLAKQGSLAEQHALLGYLEQKFLSLTA